MLLIMSDLFKALWIVIFPLVSFAHGPIQSSSSFCKATGFFIAFGFEASGMSLGQGMI